MYRQFTRAGTMVLHIGGDGGNFLCEMLSQIMTPHYLKPHLKSSLLDNEFNEYWVLNQPMIAQTHYWVMFRLEQGGELYTKQRYKDFLENYKWTKFIYIRTDPKYFRYIRILGDLKRKERYEVYSQEDYAGSPPDNIKHVLQWIKDWKELGDVDPDQDHNNNHRKIRQTDNIVKRLKKQGNHIFTINYEDVFINFNKEKYDELLHFAVGARSVYETWADEILEGHKNSFKNYTFRNYQAIDKFFSKWS